MVDVASSGQTHVGLKRLGLIVVAVIAVSSLASFALRGTSHPGAMMPTAPTSAPVHVRTAALPAPPAGSVLLATVHRTIPGYENPKGAPTVSIPPTWHGAASVLPVIWAGPGWVDVRLSQRPNESTAWVRDSDVTLSSTPYRIVVDLQTTHLSLYKSGRLEFSVPAGVGTAADPTPLGQYFVAFLAAPPSPGYGSFVMVSSAHSTTISDWESSGDALMAIHGPLGADSAIGTTGAHVSHGCVRLHNADLNLLRGVPAGSPIDVISS
jgi:lipoprotein-anchoring transpeptidase ErfK/SrfK